MSRLAAAQNCNLHSLTGVQTEHGRGYGFAIDDHGFADRDDDITDDQSRPVRRRSLSNF